MAKLKHRALLILLMLAVRFVCFAQQAYPVHYIIVDSSSQTFKTDFQNSFLSKDAAVLYINKLPALLQTKGYRAASLDSIQIDSLQANVQLFFGQQYKWAKLTTSENDLDLLTELRWNTNSLDKNSIQFSELQKRQEEILNYLEERGHPFATVFLDSIQFADNEVSATLKINRGPVYKIDSIRVYGDAKVSNEFLQRYLDIRNGSNYSKSKLQSISKKLKELLYIQEEKPSDLTLLGTGSILNLYLKPIKNSQVNALVGFLPNADANAAKKFQVTGEANILLRNALGGGETIGLNWQQLQVKSPRLNLLFEQPFIFKSPFGLNFNFDMFRKDSTFLNIDMRLGAVYGVGRIQTGSLFLERKQTIVNGINVNQVLFSRKLPDEADVKSTNLGIIYGYNNTDYRLNPRRGNELMVTSSAGTKNIRKNNQVLELKDPNAPEFKFESLYDTIKLKTYQFRIIANAAHYFPVGKQGTLKSGIQGGLFNSANVFRNEAFTIGGYKLLRGFDEESQYVSQYAVGTLEYRFLLGRNSNFFAFADGGLAKHLNKKTHTYIGTGLGLSFETKAGIFNLAWAVGKRDDTEFNLRQSKVHLGFINYF